MGRITIDKNKCKSCYFCIKACPKGLIGKSEFRGIAGKPVAEFKDENSECVGCAICARSCPDLAITEVFR